MELIRTDNWYQTPEGDDRGYIDPHELRELWFHTGTACNLECPFCLEGSKPGDQRLGLMRFDEVKPWIDEALGLGVEQFSFTGGEPFLAKQLPQILEYAAQFKPCLVLTNGGEPIQKRMSQLEPLLSSPYPVSFRVSIDYLDPQRHDAGRGEGNFELALLGLKQLYQMGFAVSVARQMGKDEDVETVNQHFRSFMAELGLPEDITIIAFPDFQAPGSLPDVPQVTTQCMTTYQTEDSRRQFMCAFSKMVVKREGKLRVYACTLVDDDLEYELGHSLQEALDRRISLKHHRCYSCFAFGASCSET